MKNGDFCKKVNEKKGLEETPEFSNKIVFFLNIFIIIKK